MKLCYNILKIFHALRKIITFTFWYFFLLQTDIVYIGWFTKFVFCQVCFIFLCFSVAKVSFKITKIQLWSELLSNAQHRMYRTDANSPTYWTFIKYAKLHIPYKRKIFSGLLGDHTNTTKPYQMLVIKTCCVDFLSEDPILYVYWVGPND